MRNIFNASDVEVYIKAINQLTPETSAKWGKMSVDQMLAHCNVTYELIYEPQKHKKPGFFARWMMKKFVKPKVTNELPYKQNLPTGPMFVIKDRKDFETEKKRLIGFLQKTQQLGASAFDGKESASFGTLNSQEWNNMMAKHLDHHLAQFGVL
ncbi:Protein of unknown function [Soonwooa buanensis]|uniref:DUF1569 domain-containing protein n=1 Tax=Soonwooa buanensis TaxID=619805 RepID=A0A1T5DKD3_9FLAO|nr:DUF1569 domain-containing protein [Soonwooa buanensis]SKB71970.1 Protein of unknown function [Soonwooa buanensis]